MELKITSLPVDLIMFASSVSKHPAVLSSWSKVKMQKNSLSFDRLKDAKRQTESSIQIIVFAFETLFTSIYIVVFHQHTAGNKTLP